MGNQAMNMSGTNQTVMTARQKISAFKAGDKAAGQWLAVIMRDPNAAQMVAPLLQAAGLQMAGGQIVPSSAGQSPGGGGVAGAPGQWATALQSMPQGSPQIQGPSQPAQMTDPRMQARTAGNTPGAQPTTSAERDASLDNFNATSAAVANAGGVAGSGGGDGLGGTPASGQLATEHPEWANTFFGSAQPGALDALAASPDQAWGMFVGQPNPGGGGNSLYNSTASGYAENDFKSGMTLGGLLGGTGSGPGDTLKYADDWTKSAIGGQGQYADPSKILQQALAVAASPENANNEANQRMIIQSALNAVEPYMDPTQYEMLMNRVGRVMNDYMVQGVNNGMQDQSGVLLDQIYGAIGAR